MNEVLIKLKKWGCDIDGAMERMCNDEEFYIECLNSVVKDSYFDILKAKLDAGDVSGAFDAAHTLKGLFANVGLVPMLDKVVEIVEPLRNGKNEDLSAQYQQLIELRANLEKILS